MVPKMLVNYRNFRRFIFLVRSGGRTLEHTNFDYSVINTRLPPILDMEPYIRGYGVGVGESHRVMRPITGGKHFYTLEG